MPELNFSEIVELIRKEDSRFDSRAYEFVRQGLDRTVKEIKKSEGGQSRSRHVAGPELLEGLRAHALEQFGPLAKTVLNTWGITCCAHFGEIVFNLIEYNVFSKNENDRREDFTELYNFDDAFVKPFLPKRPRHLNPAAAAFKSA